MLSVTRPSGRSGLEPVVRSCCPFACSGAGIKPLPNSADETRNGGPSALPKRHAISENGKRAASLRASGHQRPRPPLPFTCGPRILETGLTIDAAIAGQGIALADDGLIGDALADRRLAKLSSIALADGCYYLLSLDTGKRRQPIAAFTDWLLRETAPLRQAA